MLWGHESDSVVLGNLIEDFFRQNNRVCVVCNSKGLCSMFNDLDVDNYHKKYDA